MIDYDMQAAIGQQATERNDSEYTLQFDDFIAYW